MPSTRRPDAEASRRAILEAARRCFSERGYAGTSMSDIADAAGVTQSLIHHHFGPKDALWVAVRGGAVRHWHERLSAVLQEAGDHGPTREAMRELFAWLAEHPHVLRLIAWVELQGETSLEDVAPRRAASIATIVAAQRAGRVRADIPAEHVLVAFTTLVRTWFEDRNLVQDESDADALRRVDAAYLEGAWAVFSGGALTRQR